MTPQTIFIKSYLLPAMVTQFQYKVPTSIVMAQAILESGWGNSGLSKNANNFFGIKADKSWVGAIYNATTHEYYNGVRYDNIVDGFRAYEKPIQSFRDHAKFLTKNSRYDSLFTYDETDYKSWANGLQASGYATSPTYASKLISIINQYELYKYDKKVKNARWVTAFGIVAIVFTAYYLYLKKTYAK